MRFFARPFHAQKCTLVVPGTGFEPTSALNADGAQATRSFNLQGSDQIYQTSASFKSGQEEAGRGYNGGRRWHKSGTMAFAVCQNGIALDRELSSESLIVKSRKPISPKRVARSRPKSVKEYGQVVLYREPGGRIDLQVRLEADTLWLSQKQMSELFTTERSVITKHLRNVFTTGELEEKSNVQKMHIPNSDRPVAFYSLDAILSVGYRVNSKRGTQFRIWATQVLRDYLLCGYTVNERRLKELNQTIRLVTEIAQRRPLSSDESSALLATIRDYSYALDVLDDYDRDRVVPPVAITTIPAKPISYAEATGIITQLSAHLHSGDLFGREKDQSLSGSLNGVFQTFGGHELYPSN
jgi:hypothetical protein